jgi:selenide,water dikinase
MQAPVVKDLVLVGGGHSHVAVLKAFGMKPLPGARLTLISRASQTPYSGMLPGLIAGHYSVDEAHIDLVPLCRFAGARFVRAEAVGIDTAAGTVQLGDRPAIAYDVLSINVGSTPALPAGLAAPGAVLPVKPIDRFLAQWETLLERVHARREPTRIAVVGGGAGGVELMVGEGIGGGEGGGKGIRRERALDSLSAVR